MRACVYLNWCAQNIRRKHGFSENYAVHWQCHQQSISISCCRYSRLIRAILLVIRRLQKMPPRLWITCYGIVCPVQFRTHGRRIRKCLSRRGLAGRNRHCERSEAIQKVNKINERLDRHAGTTLARRRYALNSGGPSTGAFTARATLGSAFPHPLDNVLNLS